MTTRVLIVVALFACGPKRTGLVSRDAPVPWQASGIDWTKPPPLGAAAPFTPPPVEEIKLDNGMRVIVVENHRLPLVAITAVHAGAGSREDGDQPGLAALTADLLDEGAGVRPAAALRERLEYAGTAVDVRIATDHASMQLVTASRHLATTVALLSDMMRAPRFDAGDFERVRRARLVELEDRKHRPRTIAAQIFDRVVFGAHPYALPAEGQASTVAKLTVEDVRAFWDRSYLPSSLTLLVVGDVRAADVQRVVVPLFRTWTRGHASSLAPRQAAYAPQLAYVDVPGATQSVVLIGRRSAAAGDTRQIAADVASSIVGGGIGARLDRKLHEELALTVGVSASFWRGQWAGSWALATTFPTAKTLAGIRAALSVLEAARTEVTDDELARAKTNLRRAAQQTFETTAGTVRALERLVAQALPVDWYGSYAQRLDAVTLADVRAASAWHDLAIVVVGDWSKLGDDLTTLGLPIVRYDRDGTLRP